MTRLVVAALSLLAAAGCLSSFQRSTHTSMKLYFNDDQMREEVLRYLSIGMPIENARRIMQDSGFDCDTFWSRSEYVCDIWYEPKLFSWVNDKICVKLHHSDGKLTDVVVECSTIGP